MLSISAEASAVNVDAPSIISSPAAKWEWTLKNPCFALRSIANPFLCCEVAIEDQKRLLLFESQLSIQANKDDMMGNSNIDVPQSLCSIF